MVKLVKYTFSKNVDNRQAGYMPTLGWKLFWRARKGNNTREGFKHSQVHVPMFIF